MKDTAKPSGNHPLIAGIEVTSDTLTSRAGLALFARYLDQIGLGWFLSRWLGPLRKSAKGLPAAECVRQVLLFLVDGTSRHLTHFDSLKGDPVAAFSATAISPGQFQYLFVPGVAGYASFYSCHVTSP